MQFWWQRFIKRKRTPEKDLKALVEQLTWTLDDRLHSIVLFGSMASGEFHEEHSDVNVLVVAQLSYDALQAMNLPLKRWLKRGHTAPIIAAVEDLPGMARSFPIEFLDMLQHHRLLAGDDPFIGLSIDPRHLRAQIEHDLALLRLRLRQVIASATDNETRVRQTLLRSARSVLTLLRAATRLEDPSPAKSKLQAADHFALRAQLDVSVLHLILDTQLHRRTDNVRDIAIQFLDLLESALKYLRK